jgi:hypothetical protein
MYLPGKKAFSRMQGDKHLYNALVNLPRIQEINLGAMYALASKPTQLVAIAC